MPKLLFLITEDWWFCRHFLPVASAAREAGFDVTVATRVRRHLEQITAQGFRVIPLESERGSLGILQAAATVWQVARIIRAERPDAVHCIGLRMVLLGGLAAKLARARTLILAPTGLGHLWIANGPMERTLRPLLRWLIGKVLAGKETRYLFENEEDPREFGLDPNSASVWLIGGAGVDPKDFPQTPEPPSPPVKVAVVSRMLEPKGIAESVLAVRRARDRGAPVELHLFGATDPSNRTSLCEDQLVAWTNAGDGVFWHGPVEDIARVWREHHIAMLLSWREGLPRALVEAAASGRPIVATDVTGCREVARNDIEGLLVPKGDIDACAKALLRLSSDPDLRARLGKAAHRRFAERFTEQAVTVRAAGLFRALI